MSRWKKVAHFWQQETGTHTEERDRDSERKGGREKDPSDHLLQQASTPKSPFSWELILG